MTHSMLPLNDLTEAEQKKTVLLVDDNPINLKLLKRLLLTKKFDVLFTDNGEAAVQTYKEHKDIIDVIIMDIQMPGVDGYEATERIRQWEGGEDRADKHVPIIALTAHALANYREKSYAAGMDAFITKPVNPQQLYQLIETLIEERCQD